MIYRFKVAAKLPIFILRHFGWKPLSQKNFFNEIWLIIEDYEYIYNTEIKIEKFNSCAILGVKQFFADPPKC